MLRATNVLTVLAQLESKPLFQRLDAADRLRILLGFAAIVALGGGLILLILMGGRITKRLFRQKQSKSKSDWQKMHDDWAGKPMLPTDDTQDS